tara:strand:+ start:32 stop:412 length:381 start_codon:yes stop_codon:yes gene_type:complete
MSVIKLDSSTYFVIDYRSAPSGIGTIYFSSGRSILVTEGDCGPRDMDEARDQIKEEFLPSEVCSIPFSMGEHWDEGNLELGKILVRNDVQYVVDSELAYEFEDLVESMDQRVFSIQNWFKIRNIKL